MKFKIYNYKYKTFTLSFFFILVILYKDIHVPASFSMYKI